MTDFHAHSRRVSLASMNSRPVIAAAAVSGLLVGAVLLVGAKGKPAKPTPTPAPSGVSTPDTGTAGSTAAAPIGLDITWHGQSCFVMRTPGGTTILMDPVAFEIGYKPPTVKADLVTISHEHPDHNNLKMVEIAGSAAGGATVVRGLTEKGDWAKVSQSVGDVNVSTVNLYHDEVQGKKRGKNAAFVYDVTLARGGKRRVVHLGDLGHQLDEAQLAALKPVDVLLVPVGGHYTIDGAGANKVVEAIAPRFVVMPMHYKTPSLGIKELGPVDPFLAGKADRTVKVDGNNVEIQFGPFNFKAPGKVEGPDQLTTPMIVVLKPGS